jgi:chaperone required for assembly of F1-ATPase
VKRFYRQVAVAEGDGGWRVLLDGRAIRTAGGRPQVLPTAALADALSDEWAEQGETIDPARFVLRDLADFAIDAVAADRGETLRGLLAYAETDTLCYRAGPDEALHERQLAVWEPLLAAAERRWDVRFERVGGVMHRPQPAVTLARMETVLAAQSDFALAALRTLASLAASLTIALAAIAPGADARALWNAANLEEDWQAELWGKDAEAAALRERRFATFAAAMRFAELARA